MERLRGPRLRRIGLVAALALLPLTPLVASVVFRLAVGPGVSASSTPVLFDTYINLRTLIWSVLVVAIAAALVPAGLILMRRPSASGAWSLGLITIAVGVIGTAYAVAELAFALPTVSPFSVLLVAALSVVPAVVGVRLMRTKGLTSQQALGFMVMTLGAVGLAHSAGLVHWLVTSDSEMSVPIAALIAETVALTVVPPAVGFHFLRSKRDSPVRSLGIVVIVLGMIATIHKASQLTTSLATFEGWYASTTVDIALIVVMLLASIIVGILLIRNKTISNVQALAFVIIAIAVIGFTYCVSTFLSTLLTGPWMLYFPRTWLLYFPNIGVAILLFLLLVVALSVVPARAGVLLMRRTHASGPWALGLVAIALGIVGTTFSAVQLLAASFAPTSLLPTVGLTLLNTAWLP